MLIPFNQVNQFILSNGKQIKGILHVGAHECEEREDYNKNGIDDSKIIFENIISQEFHKKITQELSLVKEKMTLAQLRSLRYHNKRTPDQILAGDSSFGSLWGKEIKNRFAKKIPHIL